MVHLRIACHLVVLNLLIAAEAGSQVPWPAKGGDVLNTSCQMTSGLHRINTSTLNETPYLVIQGDNIEIDFNHAVLDGRQDGQRPDTYAGVAIHIRNSKNVTLRNISIRGFKIAILAEQVENLRILSCNLSYNYKPRLNSHWDRESLTDWLYFHHNEADEWKTYGAGIYLKDCDMAEIRDVVCHQGMNGIMMVGCRNGLVYNNDIRFNSGLGIGLYRSSDNRIMHNRLDWNARGYSHGQYARGQDSAAILLYEQSSRNIIAYNSGTHSGDGLFLWAGQSTMDTGTGGCDSNLIYRNDFSQSIANGIEATFSANDMIGNILNECRFGVWGGYSHHSLIAGNEIRHCETAIAIEHGRQIRIEANQISDCSTGIWLWDRPSQPQDWIYAQRVDVKGREYLISHNRLDRVKRPYTITDTDHIIYSDNKVDSADTLPTKTDDPLPSPPMDNPPLINMFDVALPEPLPDGISTLLPAETLRGLKYIIVDEWGPYDFKSPRLALRKREIQEDRETLHFDVYGPHGKWKLNSIEGCDLPPNRTGRIPDSLSVTCHTDSLKRRIVLDFMGEQIITPFGDTLPENKLHSFFYTDMSWPLDWSVMFYPYDSLSDPIHHPAVFEALLGEAPAETWRTKQLAYRWWGKPSPTLPADQFAIQAETHIQPPAGEYILEVESDDGVRIWLDDRLLLERWDIHTPVVDRVPFSTAGGPHTLRVDYFEAGGLAVLDVALRML